MKQVSLAEKAWIIGVLAVSSGAFSAWLKLPLAEAALLGLACGLLAFGIIGLLVWARR